MTYKLQRPARQSQAIDAQEAYRRVRKITASVEAHIAANGAAGLVDLCREHAGADNTAKTAILMLVDRLLGRAARDEVREVLPCT